MTRLNCDEALDMIHDRLDATLSQARHAQLSAHLESCADCRQRDAEFALLREELRDMPVLEFPAEDLERVWDRTIRAPIPMARPKRPARWLTAAAAAALFAGVLGPVVYEDYRERRAMEDFRTAMRITHRALEKTASESHAVLNADVVSAMRRVPGLGPAVGGKRSTGRR